jgi:hypothetical protein
MVMKWYVHEYVLKRRYLSSFTLGEQLSMFIMREYLSSEHVLNGENLRNVYRREYMSTCIKGEYLSIYLQ